jgi:hypothetical protein
MNLVTLAKNGTLVHGGKEVGQEPLICLSCQVELEKGYRLRSYFEMLERYPVFQELNAFFPSYLERVHASPKEGCEYPGLDWLELGKTVEMIGYPGKPRMEIYATLRGVGGDETSEIDSIQLQNLLDMPIRLGNLKHVVLGDKMDIFEFQTVFTLFEFIDAIAWELSFHGTPAECQLRR